MKPSVTRIILLFVVIALVIFDIYAAIKGVNNTISAVTLNIAMRHPVLPLIVGIIVGHLFWPQIKDKEEK